MGTPVSLNQFTADEQTPEVTPAEEMARAVETDHLCERCDHERVCAIAKVAREMQAEGDLVISRCGAYEPDDATREAIDLDVEVAATQTEEDVDGGLYPEEK